MSDQPTARDMISLPGPFRFKVILKPQGDDAQLLLALTRTALARDPGPVQLTHNPSREGKYVAYTLEVHILEYVEIETLYGAYKNHEHTVWVI